MRGLEDASFKKMTRIKRHGQFFVYMIEDKNGAYYTGYTRDVVKRFKLHQSGRGAKYLRGRRPLKLIFMKEYAYFKNVLSEERRIKSLTRRQKEGLVKDCENQIGFYCH